LIKSDARAILRRVVPATDVATWRELVEEARWAPSPHNIQPWRLRPGPDGTAVLVCPPDRLLPDTDADGIFISVGLGCFVEALVVAAAARGLALEAERTGAAPGGSEPVLRLSLGAGGADRLGAELLRMRRTSRLPYDGRPVEGELLRELADIAANYGHELNASSDRELVDWAVHLNRETLFFDMASPIARHEVGHWLRFSDSEAERRRDGFSPSALGFPGWLLRLFFRRHGLLELPVLRRIVRLLYGRTMRGTRTIAWLRGPFATVEDGLAAGRMLMRLWLTMTQAGVQLHPFGSIITNPKANALLQERIGREGATPWLIMRLGYSAEPPRSLRLETDELLLA
jgi:hypothetical protein